MTTLRLLCIFALVGVSIQSQNIPPPPDLTLNVLDVEVEEREDQRTALNGGSPVAQCSDDDPARAFIQTVTPTSPCGIKCFEYMPCGTATANSSEYCLYFLPSQGSLRYASAPMYTLTIGCTDDVEAVTSKKMTVTVVSNTPPTFVPETPMTRTLPSVNGLTTGPGVDIYDVETMDIDDDAVLYKMTTTPTSSKYIDIGYADGIIRSKTDLRFMCDITSITAQVKASDVINPDIGPLTLNIPIDPSNKAPVVNNLDTTATVDENVGADATVLNLDIVDDNVFNKVNVHMRGLTSGCMDQYYLDDTSLKTRIDPNYERSDTRTCKLYFELDDGYCKSKTYTLTVTINDINEPPVYNPGFVQYINVYEGNIDVPTGMVVYDEDLNEKLKYTAGYGDGPFDFDPNSGDIFSTGEVDIDKNTREKTYFAYQNVEDKGGLTTRGIVYIRVMDANDNAPYFISNAYQFAATECTDPGTVIGIVNGDDDDSDFQENDRIYFGGGGGKMSVMSNGRVVLNQPCVQGELNSGYATISDQGQYPGPLNGIPATISMTCGPCPPPTPMVTVPTTAPPTTQAPSTTTTAAPTTVVEDSGINTFLAWLIPAIIGGLVWLALTALLCYRYCCPCRNPCAGKCKRRPKRIKVVPEKPKKPPKPPKVEKPPKVAKPAPPPPKPKTPPPPPPPPPPEPEPDPYLFGFWKERYTDQDFNQQPARAAKPDAIENMPPPEVIPRGNAPPPEYLKLGNPGPGQHVPSPSPNPAPTVAKK